MFHSKGRQLAVGSILANAAGESSQKLPTVVLTADNPTPQGLPKNVVVTITNYGYWHIATQHMLFPWLDTSRYPEQFWSKPGIYTLLKATLNAAVGVKLKANSCAITAKLDFIVGKDQNEFLADWNTGILRMTGPDTAVVDTMHPGLVNQQ